MSGVWSELQATVGETSEGTWIGWTVVPAQVWHATDTIVSHEREHVKTEGGRAEDETMGEGSHLCEGTGEGAKGCSADNGQGAEEKDGESEGVGRASSLRMFYRDDLLRTRP